MEDREFYVYVYIDPRNFEEFYYGKGRGDRKLAHLDDSDDTEKVRRIRQIRAAGLEPVIKVVAAGLAESEAFLVEKTLIWKLGRTLTNVSSGHFAKHFRPQNSMHLALPGFDFANDIYYVNVGDGPHRCWEDCRKFGFLCAGQGKRWSEQLRSLKAGDVVVAYLKGSGYVGVGRIIEAAVPIKVFLHNGRGLSVDSLHQPNIYKNADDPDLCEYLARIDWVSTVDRRDAKFESKAGLFTSQLVRASLSRQPTTIRFIEKEFGLSLVSLLRGV